MGSLVVAEGESSMRKKIVALVAAVALGTAMMSTGAMARGGHVGGAGGGGHFAGAGGHWSGGGGRWAGGGGRWGGGWGPGVGLGIGLGLGLGGLYAYGGYPYGYCGSPYYYNSGYCAPYGYAW
jgi:hypothetical protein